MAWVFVTLRVLHAFVHVTSNDLRLRAAVRASAIVLTIMWVVFILRIMLGLP